MAAPHSKHNSNGIAIRAHGLGKRYQVGGCQPAGRFSEVLSHLAKSPMRLARRFRNSHPQANVRRTDFWALQDIDFEIARGEVVGIIGRNGAGKSTLLKVLSRITEPTCGYADLYGRVGSLLEVGTGFHPELSGRENIYLNGAILGMTRSEIRKQFDAIVDFAEIDEFLDTPVKRYSSGMYMRLAFAVAAHLDPEILVVDEVLAVGDAEFQRKCLGQMQDVARSGRTVLFVSHNMNAVEQLCNRVIWLDQGRIRQAGFHVSEILAEYTRGDSPSDGPLWKPSDTALNNNWFRADQIRITTTDGTTAPLTNRRDAEVYFEIQGEVLKESPSLNVGYALYSESGHMLYWSQSSDRPEHEWPQMQTGPVCLRSRLPLEFLNEGTYRIELIGSLHFKEWLFEPGRNSPHILLEIQGGLSQSPLWTTRRPGPLAPCMAWTNRQLVIGKHEQSRPGDLLRSA